MSPATAVLPPEDAVKAPVELAAHASAFVVTRDTKAHAEELLLALNDADKAVHEAYDAICEAAFAAHRKATAKRAEFLKPIEDAKNYLRRECGRVQRELEAEAEADARRQAEAAAQAERARLQAEAESIADTDVEAAMDVLQQADDVAPLPTSVFHKPVERAAGLTYRDNWIPVWVDRTGRQITQPDPTLVSASYLRVDTVAIAKVVRAMKDRTNIPGVRAVNQRIPVGSGR